MASSKTVFFARQSKLERAGSEAKQRLLALRCHRSDSRLYLSRESSTLYAQDFLLEHSSKVTHVSLFVLAGSGLWRFRTTTGAASAPDAAARDAAALRQSRVYEAVFSVAFGVCGASCLANTLFGGAAPYHSLPMSLTMAYFHVPAYLGFRFWRRTLNEKESSGLVENLVEYDGAIVGAALEQTKRGILVVAVAQCVASALVLGAWALPAQPLGGYGAVAAHLGASDVPLWAVRAHGLVMWVAFSLVITSTIGQYALFAFYSYLHLIEVALCGERILTHLENYYAALDGDDDDHGDGDGVSSPGGAGDGVSSPGGDASADDAHHSDHGALLLGGPERGALDLFDGLLEDMATVCKTAQRKLTRSCDQWSNIKMHYFVFALAQILVVINHVKLHTKGELSDVGYTYAWFLQDAFFLLSGISVVIVTIFVSATVTSKCTEIKTAVTVLADKRDTKINAASVTSVVDHHLHGCTVWGEVINQQKIIMIMWGFLVVTLNAIIELLGFNFNIRSKDRVVRFTG